MLSHSQNRSGIPRNNLRAAGQHCQCRDARSMSVLVQKRPNCCSAAIVRFVPIATDAPQHTAPLFDHLISASNDLRWHYEADSLGGGQIDYEIKLGRLLDRNVARLYSAQDLIIIVGGTRPRRIHRNGIASASKRKSYRGSGEG